MSSQPGPQIRFTDGAAYERYMGEWSRRVGDAFLDWLSPEPGRRWLDVGCGNGAFTQVIVDRCAPASVDGLDPSDAQLAHARARFPAGVASFHAGDALALPFADASFDVAVMPLVIFFLPQPAKGVAEMARVVAPGGLVTAYGWDLSGGGFPYAVLLDGLRELGRNVPMPPSPEAARLDVLRGLWSEAGLAGVETREITVRRTFPGFDDYWATVLGAPSAGAQLSALSPDDVRQLQALLRERLPFDAEGGLTVVARANAVKGRKGG